MRKTDHLTLQMFSREPQLYNLKYKKVCPSVRPSFCRACFGTENEPKRLAVTTRRALPGCDKQYFGCTNLLDKMRRTQMSSLTSESMRMAQTFETLILNVGATRKPTRAHTHTRLHARTHTHTHTYTHTHAQDGTARVRVILFVSKSFFHP